jgi:hypothetical protein
MSSRQREARRKIVVNGVKMIENFTAIVKKKAVKYFFFQKSNSLLISLFW